MDERELDELLDRLLTPEHVQAKLREMWLSLPRHKRWWPFELLEDRSPN